MSSRPIAMAGLAILGRSIAPDIIRRNRALTRRFALCRVAQLREEPCSWTCRPGQRGRRRVVPSADATVLRVTAPVSAVPAPLLEIRNIALRFGGIVALDGVSFALGSKARSSG